MSTPHQSRRTTRGGDGGGETRGGDEGGENDRWFKSREGDDGGDLDRRASLRAERVAGPEDEGREEGDGVGGGEGNGVAARLTTRSRSDGGGTAAEGARDASRSGGMMASGGT
jgi:hypothetical protein